LRGTKKMVDPITLEIVRNGFTSIAEQMTSRLIHSAYSYIVREMEDCSAGLFDRQGRLLAESANVPIHLACLAPCLATILQSYFPLGELEPGDILVTNDPYLGGGSMACHHTGDIITYTPVFYDREVAVFVALMVHHMDVGAMYLATRGWGIDIWQEGLRIPPLKLYRRGQPNKDIFKMILNNTRVPEMIENDLTAQAAACQIASDEFIEMIDKYGHGTIIESFEDLMVHSEKRTRDEIEKIPDGTYEHTESLCDDGAKGGPYKLTVRIDVKGSDILFDFTGTDPQIAGPINAPLSATYSAVYYVVRALTDPTIPSSDGCSRPITIIAPAGTLVNCQMPAACYQRMVTCHSIVDLIMGALAGAIPEKIMADSCGCQYDYCNALDPHTGRRVMWGEVVAGGIGARSFKDGINVMSCHVTNCPAPSIEALEIVSPTIYLQRELWEDSGGAGKYRGGLSQVLSYKILGGDPQLHHTSQKSRLEPQGFLSGKSGKGGRWIINEGRTDQRILPYAIGDIEFLKTGDTVTFYGTGGGGYGNPLDRDPEAVRKDVIQGMISLEAAEKDYGVILDLKTLNVTGIRR
jgi:N-methylhydantoinase B